MKLDSKTWCFKCDGELIRSTVFNTANDPPVAVRWLDECNKCPAMKVTRIDTGAVFYLGDKSKIK